MAYWVMEIPYEGVAKIAIESDKKPSTTEFRSLLQMKKTDMGWPMFYSMKGSIEEVDKRSFDVVSKGMKKKSSRDEIIDSALHEVTNGTTTKRD